MIAKADGVIDDGEQKLLKKIAREIGLSNDNFEKILANPEEFPIYPPENKLERDERLYHLVQMVFADKDIDLLEVSNVRKFAVALGYPVEKAGEIAVNATHAIQGGADLEEMINRIDSIILS